MKNEKESLLKQKLNSRLLRRLTSLFLSVILSIWPINVTGNDLKKIIEKTVAFRNPDTIVNEGQAAPFSGVLVSDPIYRKYQTSMDASAILQRKLDELSSIRDIPKTEDDTMKSVLYFLAGAAAGGITAAFLLR